MLLNEGLEAFKASASPKSFDLLILLIDLPIFIILLFNYRDTVKKIKDYKFKNNLILVACIVILAGTEGWHYLHNDSLYQLIKPSITPIKVSESQIVERYGTLANNLSDIVLLSNEIPMINSMKYGKEITSTDSTKPLHNIIVIQVESMDANIVNTQYKGKYIMPYLQSLTKDSVYYPYTMSYHMGGATSDCEFSAINSVEPLSGYPAIKLNSYDYPNSYIKKLSEKSYTTVAFHGNVGYYFNRSYAFSKMGFSEFDDMLKMQLKDEIWGAADHKVFNYALERMKTLESPYISYIITMTSHGPFINAGTFYNNHNFDDIKDTLVKDYFNSMSYVDQSIHDFIESVKKSSKNTDIVIYGDHTPNVNGDLYKQASFMYENKYFEFVPLFILTPDKKVYKETKKVASFLDISPTILGASGVTYNIKSDGLDLLQPSTKMSRIPYKGSSFDREFLFSKITSNSN